MVENGTFIQKDGNGWSAFMYAVARQDIELVRVFLARGARAGDSVVGSFQVHALHSVFIFCLLSINKCTCGCFGWSNGALALAIES
jgi:ankyrin repeat protein